MIKKYNLAFTPTNKQKEITAYADFFSNIKDTYKLGKKSLPHVTLCRFYRKEEEIAPLWQRLCQQLLMKKLTLTFKETSYTTSDNSLFWISLIPDNITQLNSMHDKAVKIIKEIANKYYDPHMTLVNTRKNNCQALLKKFEQSYVPIQDTFMLSLAECDPVGQCTKLIYTHALPA